MAASLPAKLKIKDITPFAVRAAQLEKYKPIVSYWCMCGGWMARALSWLTSDR